MSANKFDLAVIGAGVAGMTAALHACRKGISVALFEKEMFGGLVTNVNHLNPVPDGLPQSGGDLAAEMMAEIADQEIEVVMETVTGLEPLPSGQIEIRTDDQSIRADAVIVASGARHRKLGVPGEDSYEYRGLSHCADCDGPMFASQSVVVVGGGDSALQEAAVLAEFCDAVTIVHRGSRFSARDDLVKAIEGLERISVKFGTVVDAISGDGGVESVTLRDLGTGQKRDLPSKGIFPFVGLEPNTDFLPSSVILGGGGIKVEDNLESSVPNLFAIGAARAGYGGEIGDAIRDATRAIDLICDRRSRLG